MRRRRIYLALIVLELAAAVFFLVPWLMSKQNDSPNTTSTPTATNKKVTTEPKPNFPFIDLQPTVDSWAARQNGRASVVVYDLANGKTAGSIGPERKYFTASIYKLYVAYVGYQKVADGTYKMDDLYLSGYSRGECLDAMIRDSYSPCGEKMWNELGKENITGKLRDYGLKDTSLVALQTSARDAAIVLQRLYEKKELTSLHTNLFLASLKDQPAQYRRGLPSGFSKSTVYNKVGWNGQINWHDAAIVTLPNKRSYVITVFMERVGLAQVKALGQAIEAHLIK